MKESEALKKWCPFTRMVFGYSQGTTQTFNRFAAEPGDEMENMQEAMNGTSGTKCIGSDCMMWESWEYVNRNSEVIGKHTGDCGLKTKELQCNI